MLYDGFISYSHAADGKLAPALQRALHGLAKPWYRRRALRVFRDKTSLSANPALWPAIEQALGQSEWFLFLASPQAARSQWVQKELQWWLGNRASSRLLILLTDGELYWDNAARDFDWARTTALPRDLQGRFADEPLHVDLRWARTEDNLSVRHSQFRGAVLDVAAPLHGRAKDELDGEDVRQHRRNKAWAWSAASALVVLTTLAVGAALFALEQRNEAIAQRNEAVRQRDLAQGRQLRAEAQRLAAVDSQWTTATLLAVEALRKAGDADGYETLWKLAAAGVKPVARIVAKDRVGAPLAFSRDGRLVGTGDGEAVVISRARGGREVKRIPFPGWPRTIGFSAAGGQVVIAGDDSVKVFALATGEELGRRDDATPESLFGFSPDRRLIAIASATKIKLVEAFTGRLLAAADIPAPPSKIVVGPDGKTVALISGNRSWLLDMASGRSTALPERSKDVSSISFSADGTSAAIASFDDGEDVTVVDAATGQERSRLAAGSYHALFSRYGDLLVTGSSTALSVRDLETTTDLARIALRDSARVLDWSEDGEILAVGTGERDGSTSVFQVGTWRPLARLRQLGVPVEAIAISPQGDLVASTANRVTTVFEARQGVPLGHVGVPVRPGRLAFSADRRIVAGLLDRDTVVVFAAGTNRELARLEHCGARVLALSADGGRLAAGCAGSTARIIEVATSKVIGEVPFSPDKLAISPDGKLVFSIGPQGAAVFEAAGGREGPVIGGDSVAAAAFSVSTNRLAIARGSAGAGVFDLDAQALTPFGDDNDLIESVAFSPDGRLLALGARSRFASVYDVASGVRIARFDHKEEEKGELRVQSLAFSADGGLLASAAVDPRLSWPGQQATLRVFDLATQRELIRVPLPEVPHVIGISTDKAFLEIVVGWKNLRLERFPIDARGLIDEACARVGRNLTDPEWARYLGDAPYRKTCNELNPAALEIQ